MNASPDDPFPYTIELAERQSRQLLERAAGASAAISLLPHTRLDGLPLIGVLASYTDQDLVLRVRNTAMTEPVSLVSAYCETAMTLEDARYFFSTNILDAASDGDDLRLEVAWPVHLRVMQRRRYQRRNLRRGTAVWLTPMGREDRPPLKATLLNIGPGGVACRIDQTGAEACGMEQLVHLEFNVAACAETFRLPAYLRGQTPGASPGQVILSLEFASGAEIEIQRERLADALYEPLTALTGG
jgi:c-di-GMP-binding flagellar brake protein YcgR